MYGNDTVEPRGRRVPWMDLGELWKAVHDLLEDDRINVPWGHILAEGHDVVDAEIRATLSDGTYAFHDLVDGRYVATHGGRRSRSPIVVVFELWESDEGRQILVLTAFHGARRRRRQRGR